MSKITRFWMILLAIVTLNIGVLAFFTPKAVNEAKSITVGSYLVITGIIRLIIQLLEDAKKHGDKGFCYEDDDE